MADSPSSTASTGPTIAITMRAAWFMTFAAASGKVTRTSIRENTAGLQASLDSTPSRKRCMLSIVPCRVCASP